MAEQKDRPHIRLHVYDEEIEVVVNRDDEEYYRRAAKLITERCNAYSQAYKGRKSDHTIALMTLIDIALMYQKERTHNDTSPYDNVLARLTAEIEEVPYSLLKHITNRITAEVKGVNRVLFDLTPKPTGTIEWE